MSARYKAGVSLAGPLGFYMARGLAATGMPNDNTVGFLFEDFIPRAKPGDWTHTENSGGTITPVAGTKGGISRMATSTTINGNAQSIASSAAAGSGPMTGSLAVDKWYFAWRFRVPSTPDTNTRLGVGFTNGGQTRALMAGVFVNLNATKFCVQYDGVRAGSQMDLGVAFDTAFHVVEVWHPGDGKYHARLDGAAEVAPVTPATPPLDAYLWNDAFDNGVAGVDHQIDRDWGLYLFTR